MSFVEFHGWVKKNHHKSQDIYKFDSCMYYKILMNSLQFSQLQYCTKEKIYWLVFEILISLTDILQY